MKRQFLFTIFVILMLAVSVTGIQPVAAQTVSARISPGTSTPLEQLLNSDGTLDLERGFQGSLDATGWQMVTGANGEPRFAPASSTRQFMAVSGDENWDDRFGPPGPDNYVVALAVSGDEVYAGGYFTTAGGVPANYIAKWDGTSWAALGSGTDGGVRAIAVNGSDVYVGGQFTSAGGVPANNIAKWDGSAWSALGSGVNGVTVLALAVSGSDVYVGGWFNMAGGVAANNIAKWDGTSWSALGTGLSGDTYNSVSVLAVSGSDVYAGGHFLSAGGVAANHIAKWNGTSWSALGSGVSGYGYYDSVSAIAVSGSDVYVGGYFLRAGGVIANNIAKWDGTSWSALGSGTNANVDDLAISDGDVYAGGQFFTAGGITVYHTAKWDGASWSALGSGTNGHTNQGEVYALAANGSNVYAGGFFSTAGGVPANYIARWDGTSWSGLHHVNHSGLNGDVLALAASGRDVYAGGYFTNAGGVPVNHIAKWDGTSWSALGSGLGGSAYYNVVDALAVSGSDVYAGGSFTSAGGVPVNYIAKWDGTSWSALGSGMNGGVYAIAVSGSDVYAGGYFTTAGGVPANSIAKWDGTSWSALGSGLDGGYGQVRAIAVNGSDVYVGGSFRSVGGVPADYIAKWDGASWSALGSGMSGGHTEVLSLAVNGSDVYVGGNFTWAGGVLATGIAKWDGTSWSALGSGLNPEYAEVLSLTVSGSDVYAGGYFTTAGGVPAKNIAKWDGASWSALGSGTNFAVGASAVSGSGVYVGGYFNFAGGKPSSFFGGYMVNQPPTAEAGGPYSVDEGSSIPVTASGDDPEAGALTYAWDLDNDGTFETPGQSVSFSAALLDGPGTYTIAVQVTDDGGLTATSPGTVNVINVAPTATFTGTSDKIVVGGSVTFSFNNGFDPGAADLAAGLQYSYDCTNDGTFELANASNTTSTCSYPNSGTFNALGRIADKDGGYTDYTVQVTVLTPREGTEGLIDQVQELIPGTLNSGQGNALIAKLEGVIKQLEKGNPSTAINELQAFINQVNSFMNATPPLLTPEEGQPLIDAANAIIAALGG